ncbi:MAG: PTS sugar transporter subunit IIC [Clostridia bacterium]|nr:PTS sugar transporter subunit IIC [Clostridia bacterium]
MEGIALNKEKNRLKAFLDRKNVKLSAKVYFVDAMGSMAFGLFASLLIGTIFNTLAGKLSLAWLAEIASYSTGATGAAMAVAIGYSLGTPSLVLFSLCAVGIGANSLGGPLGTLFSVIVASELGKLVSKETKVDILVTPTVTIVSGILVANAIGPGVSAIMTGFGSLIMTATVLQPFWMGILVSVLVGIALTLPISSAAICATLGLVGLAGGAATAGCCAQMVGFAVMSFSENRWGGILAQGLGTSMLQMGNIVKNPRIWIPPTIAGAITGPLATCVFGMENGVAVASGMGTCGLVGPIGVISSAWFSTAGLTGWLAIILICILLPATLTPLIAYPMRKKGWIKPGDLKLDL